MRLTKRELLADGVLLLTALIWGSAFAIVKNSLDAFAPAMLITLRYVIATPLAALAFRKHLRGLTRGDIARGAAVGLLYLSVLSTTVGMSLQNIGQSMAPSSHASILLSLESVFGVIFSCIILGETVTGKMLAGFVMIFAAVLVSEMTPRRE